MDFDAIVIGSGMGGLSAASLLTQLYGKRVLIRGSLAPAWFRRLARWTLAKRVDSAYQSTRDFLSGLARSPELRCALDAQWGTYGIPPAQSPMLWNAMIFWHYAHGAYYPQGGAGEIAKAAAGIVKAGGGDVLLQSEAVSVLIEDGAARGVRVRSVRSGAETEYRSPLIISDIGARATYARFLRDHPSQTRDDVAAAPMGSSTVTVYLGLKESPEKLGIHGENLWIADGIDHDRSWAERNRAFEGKPVMAFVSFASQNGFRLKGHTAQIVAPMDYELFGAWAGKPWRQRGEDYERRKALIAEGLIAFVDKRVPGFRDLIAYSEVSTPLTVEHFTSHPMGQICGIPAVLGRKEWAWISPETPIRGLYLTEADVVAGGVTAALMGGVITLAKIFGVGVFRKVFF